MKYTVKYEETHGNIALRNALVNLKVIAQEIQKQIVSACAVETSVILSELGDSFFSILVDESHDISIKEQMAVVLR